MTAKDILFDRNARAHIGAGLDALANAVKVATQNASSVASLMLTTEALIAQHAPVSADRAPA